VSAARVGGAELAAEEGVGQLVPQLNGRRTRVFGAAVEELCRGSEEGLRYRRGDLAEEGRAGGRRKGERRGGNWCGREGRKRKIDQGLTRVKFLKEYSFIFD